jgi:hypothetical protein
MLSKIKKAISEPSKILPYFLMLPKKIYSNLKYTIYVVNTWKYEIIKWVYYYCFDSREKTIISVESPKLISIIIPTLAKGKQRNHFLLLKKLLCRYLPNQKYNHYEAIVYCDGPNQDVYEMVTSLSDERIKVYSSDKTFGLYGHPQTREGIKIAKGDFFIRMNDDNYPHPEYLETLLGGFDEHTGVVYGRVAFKGKARQGDHCYVFLNEKHRGIPNDLKAFILPRDIKGSIWRTNIDCMNYMVRMEIAKQYIDKWSDDFAADWFFIEAIQKAGIQFKFVDRLIGDKR